MSLKDRKLTVGEKTTFDELTEILWRGISLKKISVGYQRGDGFCYFRSLHDFGYFEDSLEVDLIPSVYIFEALVELSDFNDLDSLTPKLRKMYDLFTNLCEKI